MEIQHPDFKHISINSEICFGKPRISGTRMPVANILEYLSSGMSVRELQDEFPFLTEEDIMEALAFSARMMQDKYFSLKPATRAFGMTFFLDINIPASFADFVRKQGHTVQP